MKVVVATLLVQREIKRLFPTKNDSDPADTNSRDQGQNKHTPRTVAIFLDELKYHLSRPVLKDLERHEIKACTYSWLFRDRRSA